MNKDIPACESDLLRDLERDLSSRDDALRWKAASTLTDFAISDPESVWPLILRYGSSDDEDLRTAVATCILEHLLEHHFEKFFPAIKHELLLGNKNLEDTLKLSWKFGKAENPENAARWESLLKRRT